MPQLTAIIVSKNKDVLSELEIASGLIGYCVSTASNISTLSD